MMGKNRVDLNGRIKSRGAGQALAEFMLIIPLFFVLLLGILQMSRIYLAYQAVHYAAFAACRAAIVRPCAAFHPDNDNVDYFSPAVFAAAVFSIVPIATNHDLGFRNNQVPIRQTFFPALPDTDQVDGLDFDDIRAPGDIADLKFINAQSLTAIRRVWSSPLGERPVTWTAYDSGAGPGWPCMEDDGTESAPQQQNVPPPGHDLTLEVSYIFPMTIPFVNRVIYGIFVTYSSLGLAPLSSEAETMKLPGRMLARPLTSWWQHISDTLHTIVTEYDYDNQAIARMNRLRNKLDDEMWFPLPIRARCTLTVEGAVFPLISP